MCGRFVVETPRAELARIFSAVLSPGLPLERQPNWNVTPTSLVDTIYSNSPQERLLDHFTWGLTPSWATQPIINARHETILEKPTFKGVFRCVIPADGFYEFKRADKRSKPVPHYFKSPSGHLLAFAAIYGRDPTNKINQCAIITSAANKDMVSVHSRMPIILSEDSLVSWLDSEVPNSVVFEGLAPNPDGTLVSYPVSNKVNSPANNFPELVLPAQT